MTYRLAELLRTVDVGVPQEAEGLQLFGLRWLPGRSLPYATLDEALAEKTLEISEVSASGSVPTLRVSNRGDRMVFLMAGEQLIGAKQNRILNASILVPAQSELPIPVSCVEAGRWRYRSPHFSSDGTMAHGALRKVVSHGVKGSYERAGQPTSDQGAVWGEVARKLTKLGSVSASSELHQAYADHAYRLSDFLAKLTVPAGCSGVAFALGGRLLAVDLFDQPATLVKLWEKLIRAYALDALEEAGETKPAVSAESVRHWLQEVAEARPETFKSPGLGDDIRLEGTSVVGAGLVVDEVPIHVELFAEVKC
jgi:hypothetical protein